MRTRDFSIGLTQGYMRLYVKPRITDYKLIEERKMDKKIKKLEAKTKGLMKDEKSLLKADHKQEKKMEKCEKKMKKK